MAVHVFIEKEATVMTQALPVPTPHGTRSFVRSALLTAAVAMALASCGSDTTGSESDAGSDSVAAATTPPEETAAPDTTSLSEPTETTVPVNDVSTATITPSLTLPIGNCTFPYGSEDGLQVFQTIDGRLMRYDLTTGDVVDHGEMPGGCGVWIGDLESGRKATEGDEGIAFGPLDGPLDVQLPADREFGLISRQIVGNRVLIGSFDTGDLGILVFDATTGELVTQVDGLASPWSSTFGGDGSLIGMTSTNTGGGGEAILLDAETGTELHRVAIDDSGEESIFDQSTGEMIVASAGGELITIDVESGEVVAQVPRSSSADVVAVGVRPDGMVVVATEDQVEVVDRLTGPTGIAAPIQGALAMRIRPDGTVLKINNDATIDIVALEGSGPLIDVAPPA